MTDTARRRRTSDITIRARVMAGMTVTPVTVEEEEVVTLEVNTMVAVKLLRTTAVVSTEGEAAVMEVVTLETREGLNLEPDT